MKYSIIGMGMCFYPMHYINTFRMSLVYSVKRYYGARKNTAFYQFMRQLQKWHHCVWCTKHHRVRALYHVASMGFTEAGFGIFHEVCNTEFIEWTLHQC